MIKELINNPKSKYIIITFLSNAVGLIRNLIVLKILKVEELGFLTLGQTIIATISILQFGVVTGGFRLFSYKSNRILYRINSAVFTFFIIFSFILVSMGLVFILFYKIEISFVYFIVFIFIAILSLYSNWVICKLIATKNVNIVNKSQFSSNILSLIITISSIWFGFNAVILAMLTLPSIIIFIAYNKVPKLIPYYNLFIFKKYIKKIISIGFVPYLTSVISLVNTQLGRWIVTFTLGTIVLGQTYLATMFVLVVGIFPNSIANLFFPTIIENFEKKMHSQLKSNLYKYYIVLTFYFVFVIGLTLLLIDLIVRTFLSNNVESISLIYVTLPTLLFISFSNPSIILFNAAKKFNYIFIGSLLLFFSYVILIITYLFFWEPKLIGFYIIESISAFLFFAYNSFYYTKLNALLNINKSLVL
jgi:O-antigen/teichoic acid export membrane protein